MTEKAGEKTPSKNRFFLRVEDLKSSVDTLSSRQDTVVKDTFPPLNLIAIENTKMGLNEIKKEMSCSIVKKSIIDKIEPAIIGQLRMESVGEDVIMSTLIDLEPFSKENIERLEELKEVVVEKSYPYISLVHASFPAKVLLDIAQLDCVKKISDSKGDIRPTSRGVHG